MRWRYSDKPHEMFPEKISDLEKQADYMATQKMDGWHCTVVRDKGYKSVVKAGAEVSWEVGDGLFFLSRRSQNAGGPTQLPVSDEIIDIIKDLDLPDQSAISTEWMARRTIGEIGETLFLLTPMWFDNDWLGEETYSMRHHMMMAMNIKLKDPVRIPDMVESGYQDFFDAQKEIPYTEGMVLAHKNATIVGNRKESKKNAQLIKIKWRSGFDGRDVYVPPKS